MYNTYKDKIAAFYQTYKRMPSYKEIMDLVGFKSKNSVYKLVNKLVEEGVVSKDKTGKLIPSFTFNEIPLLGLVEAGVPSVAEVGELDSLSLDEYLAPEKEKTFLLEVKGDSMIEAHIEEGDYVIAVRTEAARDGDIVVAEVDGEWTLKYFREEGNLKWLVPANKKYKPIYPAQSLRIAAIIKGVVRKY